MYLRSFVLSLQRGWRRPSSHYLCERGASTQLTLHRHLEAGSCALAAFPTLREAVQLALTLCLRPVLVVSRHLPPTLNFSSWQAVGSRLRAGSSHQTRSWQRHWKFLGWQPNSSATRVFTLQLTIYQVTCMKSTPHCVRAETPGPRGEGDRGAVRFFPL